MIEYCFTTEASPPAETYSGNFGASGAQKPSLLGLCQHAAQKALAKGPVMVTDHNGKAETSHREVESEV